MRAPSNPSSTSHRSRPGFDSSATCPRPGVSSVPGSRSPAPQPGRDDHDVVLELVEVVDPAGGELDACRGARLLEPVEVHRHRDEGQAHDHTRRRAGGQLVGLGVAPPGEALGPPPVGTVALDEEPLAEGDAARGVVGEHREARERGQPPGEHPVARPDVVREPQPARDRRHRPRGGHVAHAPHPVPGLGQAQRRGQPDHPTADHRHPCHALIVRPSRHRVRAPRRPAPCGRPRRTVAGWSRSTRTR